MAEKQVRIDLTANDKASDKIRDVADEAKKLEKLDPEVEVEADTRKAERQLEDVTEDLDELRRKDTEIVLKGKVSKLKSDLAEAETALKQVQGKAEDTKRAVDDIGGTQGPRIAGNQVSDLTGPLGEASGAAGDFGGVMDGVADIVEGAMTRMGASAASVGAVSGVLGGVGFAVAGLAAAYSYFSGKAKKAAEDQKQFTETYKDFQEAVKEGDADKAADEFLKLHDNALKAAEALGLTTDQFVDYVNGKGDLSALNEEYLRNTAIIDANAAAIAAQQGYRDEAAIKREQEAATWLKLYDEVVKAKDAQDGANESSRISTERQRDVARALDVSKDKAQAFADAQDRVKRNVDKTKDAMDRLRGSLDMERALLRFSSDFQAAHDKAVAGTKLTSDEILGLKEDILDVADYADLNPVEVKSLLDRIEAGDYMGVKTDVETMARNNPPSVETKLQTPSDLALQNWLNSIQRRINAMGGRVYVPGGGFVQPGGTAATASVPVTTASVVNVTQNVPRGYHGDVLADAQAAAKRSGGLYFRNGR